MKREKLRNLNEIDIIRNLILSDEYCDNIINLIDIKFFEVSYSRIIYGWIKDFYSEYNVAPKKDILKLYRSRISEIDDESLQENILTFIEKTLDREVSNVKFAISESVKHLKALSLKSLAQDIESYIADGDISKAEKAFLSFKTVEKKQGNSVSILKDSEKIINAYTEENQILFTLPGDFGKCVGDIHREDFIGVVAPMKGGKSFMLLEFGVEAMKQGLKVLHISLEMSETQNIKRYWTALSGKLIKAKDDIELPKFVKNDDKYDIEFETVSRGEVNIKDIKNIQQFLKRISRGGDIRIYSAPAFSLTVEALEIELDRMYKEENYAPDVIIVDYADIMKPSINGDYRQQLDMIWKKLRAMAQDRKCAVFTASQSGRKSIGGDVGSQDIAEDIRKLAHITSMVSINQKLKEKKKGYFRLKQLAVREGESFNDEVVCLQCLSLSRMVVNSKKLNDVNIEDD